MLLNGFATLLFGHHLKLRLSSFKKSEHLLMLSSKKKKEFDPYIYATWRCKSLIF